MSTPSESKTVMITPQDAAVLIYGSVQGDMDHKEVQQIVAAIQKEAFECGRREGLKTSKCDSCGKEYSVRGVWYYGSGGLKICGECFNKAKVIDTAYQCNAALREMKEHEP